MYTSTNCSKFGRHLTVAVAFHIVAAVHAAATTVDVSFYLAPPSEGANQFDVVAHLNTLVPGSTSQPGQGSVEWGGQIDGKLHLDMSSPESPVVLGIEIPWADISQTPLEVSYFNLPAGVQFSTSELHATLVPKSGMDSGGPYAAGTAFENPLDAFQFMQTQGTAGVGVEGRSTETQDLGIDPVMIEPGDNLPPGQAGAIAVEMMGYGEGDNYKATLRMPLGGSVMNFAGTGLPVAWEFMSGEMVAEGTFSFTSTTVPEPSSIAMLGLAAAALAAVRLRKDG